MNNTFLRENLLPRLTFNPGLALTGFQTTRSRPYSLLHFVSPGCEALAKKVWRECESVVLGMLAPWFHGCAATV